MKVYILTHEPYMDNSAIIGAFGDRKAAMAICNDMVPDLLWLRYVGEGHLTAELPHGEQYRIYEVDLA